MRRKERHTLSICLWTVQWHVWMSICGKESGNQEEVSIPSLVVVTGVALTGFISPEKIGNNTSSAIYMLSRKQEEVPEETLSGRQGHTGLLFLCS